MDRGRDLERGQDMAGLHTVDKFRTAEISVNSRILTLLKFRIILLITDVTSEATSHFIRVHLQFEHMNRPFIIVTY